MTEREDVQGTVIGIGTVVALACYAYGRFVAGSIFGADPTAVAVAVFGATFAVLAILHGAYGRRDFALAHGVAAVGLFLLAPASSGSRMLVGYLLLLGGGLYVAVVTMRVRREQQRAEQPG
ncbi:hypothetical protein [Halopiger goleimassiliensis]|uniref:hypothetical protein n=1 Tax=Halopiger goleimassiliensis TaxID=1293048 RepID=UPI000677E267|nr:hypothetical protein [Halopiger goleimassiliensis]